MAKDLGTITHEIKTTGGSGGGGGGGGKSNTDALTGSGRGGGGGGGIGGAGDVIRGISRGGPLGGGQAMAKVAGFAKLAAGIGIAIAAFSLVTIAVKKVIGTLVKWGKEIESGIKKFSVYHAGLAMVAAEAQIGKIKRDIISARILAPSYIKAGRSMERIRDAFRPVADAWLLVKAHVMNTLLPVVESLVEALRLLTIKIIETIIFFNEMGIGAGKTFNLFLGAATSAIPGGFTIPFFSRHVLGIGNENEKDEEFIEGLKRLEDELKKANIQKELAEINKFIGLVGVQLTGGTWNPWQKPGTHMIPITQSTTGQQLSRAFFGQAP